MSLTDDMLKLKETADRIAFVRGHDISAPVSIVDKIESSYYEKRTADSNDVKVVLREYGFETPVELRAALTSMWEEMEKTDMCGFIPVSMAAAVKNKPKQGGREIEQGISPFIYEF